MKPCTALLSALILATAMPAFADSRPAVAELFTSEACSSCPPADALLGELAKRPDVVALAWHVDYWNAKSWRDRFTLAEATPRQTNYERRLKLDSLYTPQMVVDGTRDVIGSERTSVLAALSGKRDGVAVSLRRDGGDLIIALGPGQGSADALLVTGLASARTSVAGGENGGRHLDEFNIVRAIKPAASWNGSAATLRVPLSELPKDSTFAALLLQEPDQGAMLGAAIIPLD